MERVVLDKSRCGWWKSAVFYELYPKSFQDTTGSGTGDLRGILSHLDYLETLGVDAIWLCPICASPQVDNGYDISDFCAIEPSFGTMADMDELIAESKKRGIGILIDLTLNHCSDQHRWFRAAKSSRENPYHDYFLWRDGTPDCPPSGMRSVFGGSAWTYVPEIGQWYFHQFAPEQPDMNWENPKLRQELYDVMKFWVKKGVAGFRLDVIDQIAKEPDKDITINGPRLHEYLRGISENVLTDEGLVTVGEAWGADTERAKRYSAPDGSELSMVFQFEHIGLDQEPGKDKWDMIPLELPRLKECLRRWQQELYGCGWNSLFFNNHDLPRIVSRWGNDKEYRVESAKMLATMLYGLQGTPYIYQGEELGMTNIRLPLEQYQDLEMFFLLAGMLGKSILQNGLLNLGAVSFGQLLEQMQTSRAAMLYATLALLLQAMETCAVPIFAFLLVEGVEHTSSLRNYALRVAGLAVLSELPYNLATSGKLLDTTSRNPVFGLVVCLVMVYLYQKFPEKNAPHLLLRVLVTAAAVIWCSMLSIRYGNSTVVLFAALWAFRGKGSFQSLVGSAVSILCCIFSLFFMAAPMGFLAIHFYNGEKGPENRIVDYLAYPALLLVVGAAGRLLF